MADDPQHRSATSYKVTIAGKEYTQPKDDAMQSLTIEDHVDMIETMTLRLGGAEGQETWQAEVGQSVEVKMGEGSVVLFKGEITNVKPSWGADGLATLTLTAMDNCHRLARGRKTRFFEKKKDSDVAQTVGSESGLSVDAEATTETHDYILQRNESNYAFLKRLAARNNYQLAVDEGKLIFKKAKTSGSPTTIEMGKNLRTLNAGLNTGEMAQKVVVRGWDIRTKKEIVGTATSGDIEKIGGGMTGPDVAAVYGDHTAYVTDVPIQSQSQATDVAKAEMNRLARQFMKGTGVMDGNDAVRANTVVELKGVSKGYNGKVYIISTRHIITANSGYLTEFTFCSNTMGT